MCLLTMSCLITWIFLTLGVLYKLPQGNCIGCRTVKQKFLDSIDLQLVLKEEVEEDAPTGQRRVIKYKQSWQYVDVLGYGATFNALTGEPIIQKFAECIWVDLKSNKSDVSLDEAVEIAAKPLRRSEKDLFFPSVNERNSRLLIYVDPVDNKAKLIWSLNIAIVYYNEKDETAHEPSNAFAIVNANTGELLSLNEYVESYLMTGDGGNVKVGRKHYGDGKYVDRKLLVTGCAGCPKCVASNPFVEVTSANGQQYFWEPARCFTANPPYEEQCDPPSPSSDATNQSYSQVHDALYYATSFREMLRDVYGDKTLDKCSKTGQIKICVHYGHRNMAVFKDTGNCEIYFGEGFKYFYDPASVTLVAHELGHALIKVTSNLEYRCQTGAIAESFSDICAVTFQAYINNLDVKWSVGGEITREIGIVNAVRFLDDPPADFISIDCTRDYPYDMACRLQDPHTYAGVYNKGFYNLATTENWNVLSAFEVFLRATKFYWQAVDGFDAALCGLIEATVDLYGPQGAEVAFQRASDVSRAFAKVGVVCSVVRGSRQTVATDKLGQAAAGVQVSHQTGCGNNWITLNNFTDEAGNKITSCFKIVPDKATWAEACIYCESIDSNLATIDNQAKADWLYSQLLASGKGEYWVGGTDMASNDQWRWTHRDVPLTWTDWNRPNRKHNRRNEKNCLALDVGSNKVTWNAERCWRSKQFVCERTCCGLQCRRNNN